MTATLQGDDSRQPTADSRQRLQASNVGTELLGNGGDDHLLGGLSNDTLEGGAGRDVLLGLTGSDTFRYTALTDSYRDATQSFSDRILDFDLYADRIDVSALGFSGLGDGQNSTLAVTLNETGTNTYLQSHDANAAGQRFQLTLAGDLGRILGDEQFVFASTLSVGLELLGEADTRLHP